MSAACIKSYDKAEKGTLSPLECLSFANNIQADLPISLKNLTKCEEVRKLEKELIMQIILFVRKPMYSTK